MRDQPTDAEMLVTLVEAACARQSLPADVTRWAAKRLLEKLPPRVREAARDEALRRAAEFVTDGSDWARATDLRDEAQQIADEWTLHVCHPPRSGTIEAHLVTALTLGSVPASTKQMWRIITNNGHVCY
jgi:hypothetical protein